MLPFDLKKNQSLIVSIFISLGVGLLAGVLTKNSMAYYNSLVKPPLSPPSILFPIVWTILYILMGISAYLIYKTNSPYKKDALLLYLLQLIVNFFWPIIFFNLHMLLLSAIWIILLWVLIVKMIILFYKVNKPAALLQIPYLLWVTFATYLNIAFLLLN